MRSELMVTGPPSSVASTATNRPVGSRLAEAFTMAPFGIGSSSTVEAAEPSSGTRCTLFDRASGRTTKVPVRSSRTLPSLEAPDPDHSSRAPAPSSGDMSQRLITPSFATERRSPSGVKVRMTPPFGGRPSTVEWGQSRLHRVAVPAVTLASHDPSGLNRTTLR